MGQSVRGAHRAMVATVALAATFLCTLALLPIAARKVRTAQVKHLWPFMSARHVERSMLFMATYLSLYEHKW